MTTIVGQVQVSVSRKAECYGGRRLHLRLDGLPGWILALITEAGPFVLEAQTSSSVQRDDSGPYSVLLGSSRVVDMIDRAPSPLIFCAEGDCDQTVGVQGARCETCIARLSEAPSGGQE